MNSVSRQQSRERSWRTRCAIMLLSAFLVSGVLQPLVRSAVHAPDTHSSLPHFASSLTLTTEPAPTPHDHLVPPADTQVTLVRGEYVALQGRLDVEPPHHPPRLG